MVVLYHLPLQGPQCIEHALIGNFSGNKNYTEVILSYGTELELVRVSGSPFSWTVLNRMQVYGVIHSLAVFRMLGSTKDLVIMSSDSGRVTVLEYIQESPGHGGWAKLHQETVGRSGTRRTVPSLHLAADSQGRAFMLASCDGQKLAFTLSRDIVSQQLVISSPLESNAANTVIQSMISLDMGYENPIFICIEIPGHGDKQLVTYELDLGLNHIARRHSMPICCTSHLLVRLSDQEKPSFLLCRAGSADHMVLLDDRTVYCASRLTVPKRVDPPLISTAATYRTKAQLLTIIQTEHGDLFQLDLHTKRVAYLDTIAPASTMGILPGGYLLCGPEFGSNAVYQIVTIPELSHDSEFIESRSELTNLFPVKEYQSLSPIRNGLILPRYKDASDRLEILFLHGTTGTGAVSVFKRGAQITELASSDIPGAASGIWTIEDPSTRATLYIIISFPLTTTVLQVSESGVEEMTSEDTTFLPKTRTIFVQSMKPKNASGSRPFSIIQVHPNGWRCVKADGRASEWVAESDITMASGTPTQLAVLLENTVLVYFAFDELGDLSEIKRIQVSHVNCMTWAPTRDSISKYLVLGLADQTIRVYQTPTLEMVAMQVLPGSQAHSISCWSVFSNVYIYVGLENGICMSWRMDEPYGRISTVSPRAQFISSGPIIQFCQISAESTRSLLLTVPKTSSPWLIVDSTNMAPLRLPRFGSIAQFNPLGQDSIAFTGISGGKLYIISLEGDPSSLVSIESLWRSDPSLVPRSCLYHPGTDMLLVSQVNSTLLQSEIRAVGLSDFISRSSSFIDLALENGKNIFVSSMIFCTFNQVEYLAVGYYDKSYWVGLYLVTSDPVGFSLVHKTQVTELPASSFLPMSLCCFQASRLLVGIGDLLRMYDLGKQRLLRKCEIKAPQGCRQIVSVHDMKGLNRIALGDGVGSGFTYLCYDSNRNGFNILAVDDHMRHITSSLLLDVDTMAGGDKFGNFFIVRLPKRISEQAIAQSTFVSQQVARLESVAEYHLGDIVTYLDKAPSTVPDASDIIIYATINGSIGAMIPVPYHTDAHLLTRLGIHMRSHVTQLRKVDTDTVKATTSICGRSPPSHRSLYVDMKNVLDGSLLELFSSLPVEQQEGISRELDERTPEEITRKLEEIRLNISF